MQKNTLHKTIIIGLFFFMPGQPTAFAEIAGTAENRRVLTIESFIQLAAQNDTVFEEILLDMLPLRYRKDLMLPADDILLSIKGEYDFFLSQDRHEPGMTVSLSKLFPYTGTVLSSEYRSLPSFHSEDNSSAFTVMVSQPVAENAFGRSVKLQDKIIGLETDMITHQVVEAYEDYMARIVVFYYNWYEAYQNMNIGESSYKENLKLLDNIKEREKNHIALPIDVNKISLQVLAKREKLIELKEKHQNALNIIQSAIRSQDSGMLIPGDPDLYPDFYPDRYSGQSLSFTEDFKVFKEKSRTYGILNLLEEKSSLEIDKNADDLLPSISLFAGYAIEGDDHDISNSEDKISVGVSVEWPFDDQKGKAEHEIAKIEKEKIGKSNPGIHSRLYTNIKNLYLQIEKERELVEIAKKRIALAQTVLIDEAENYSFGKVTLNDYISAVNILDNAKFNKIFHDAQYKKMLIERLRILDQLINKKKIQSRHKNSFFNNTRND